MRENTVYAHRSEFFSMSAFDPLRTLAKAVCIPPMNQSVTNLSLTLEELTGSNAGNPDDAPTYMVEAIIKSWKKPLNRLSDEEIGRLVVQHDGYPYVLDLVWPKLERNPLLDGGYYPGDVLSNLIRADASIWADRPQYKGRLDALYRQALERPDDENRAFRGSLQLPGSDSTH